MGESDAITVKDLRTELRLFSTEKFHLRVSAVEFQWLFLRACTADLGLALLAPAIK